MARLTIDVTGIDTAAKQLGALAAAGRDLTPVMRDIGEYLVRSTKDRFEQERAPDGSPWQPLSETTRRRKKRNKNRILTESGLLGGQIAYQAGPAEVLVGSGRVYAGTHQFGAKRGAFGRTAKGGPIPWGDIPARPFLGLSDADANEITALVAGYLASKL